MSWLLDTNTCIAYLNGDDGGLIRRFVDAGPDRLAVSDLTAAELYFGAERSSRKEANRKRVEAFLRSVASVPFDRRCGGRFGRLKAAMLRSGKPIPDFDLGIAATALIHGAVLVSEDRHMKLVPGLPVESWLEPG